jgi:hypothetical protein
LRYLGFLIICFAQASTSQVSSQDADPFAFFQPSVPISASDRAQLDSGSPVARVLPSKGLEVGVLAAVPVSVDGDRLVAWQRQIEALKKSQYVIAIGRFSNPPRIEDLERLELDKNDVNAIRACRPQSCELKLSAAEMKELQQAASKGDSSVQQAFRQIVLNRVNEYLSNGQTPTDEDHREDVQPSERFTLLLDHMPFLKQRLPELDKDLRDFPSNSDPEVESFLYWSKEHLARKPTVSVTHVNIVRSRKPGFPDAMVVGRDVFSLHYVDASLSVTALMRGDTNRMNYLVYVNRTEVDVLHGMFGGMIRKEIQNHLKNAGNVLMDVRDKLQSGNPPQGAHASAQPNSQRPSQ